MIRNGIYLKISGIQNLTDARYAAGVWADWAGFCFDLSNSAYINPVTAKEIIGWVNGPQITGEFGHTSPESITDITELLDISVIQIPADYPAISQLPPKPLILEYRKGMDIDLQVSNDSIWLVRSAEDYDMLAEQGQQNIILELPEHNINMIKTLQPYGIALNSIAEAETGIRDYENWNDLLELLETDV